MNMFPSNMGVGDSKNSNGYMPNSTPYPVLYPSVPANSGIFGIDNTLTTIFYIGAALTLFSLIFFPRRTI